MMRLLLSIIVLTLSILGTAKAETMSPPDAESAIREAIDSPQRNPKNAARDIYRHPFETLSFFGLTPTKTVVEIWPSGGWYAEILAPLLREKGKYIAALQGRGNDRQATITLFESDAKRFDKAVLTTQEIGKPSEIATEGTADIVLTFRNVHNFLKAGDAASAQFFSDCFRALKPGGILGVVDHHLPEEADIGLETTSGYIKSSTVIRLATAAGFVLDGESAINANAKDDHKHPKGVWTLPPSYALKDIDRSQYEAIGESDRFTLRFVKPDQR